jgi:hypothetical protein
METSMVMMDYGKDLFIPLMPEWRLISLTKLMFLAVVKRVNPPQTNSIVVQR